VMLALLKPGDTFLGMSLAAGGHLSHGAAPNLSGKWFRAVQYGVRQDDGLLDYEELERLARTEKPKLIIAGGSAYPRTIDFARIRAVADEVGAVFMVDMAHFAGLVAGGVYPSPLPHAHVVTTTTHKTLRGPRGGMILSNDPDLGKKINSAMFPGLQGGPLMHVIAAKAVAFGEALRPEFRTYQKQVVANAKALSETLVARGFDIVTGGTDSHLLLVDLRPKRVTGKLAEASLERAHMTANKNAIPFDPEKPAITSGVRLGTPAATTRGFGEAEFRAVGEMIDEVLTGLSGANDGNNSLVEEAVGLRVQALCARFPIYPN
jgi:glycine hydroxymethyltransferase